MEENNDFWDILISISKCNKFIDQLVMFRFFAETEALRKVDFLVDVYIRDFSEKLQLNPYLTPQKYREQCDSLVTPFLFQAPLFPCKDLNERLKFNEVFSNWDYNSYVLLFCKKMREALSL